MKSISEIVNESQSKTITKTLLLTMMIPYQMWTNYKAYDNFFGKLDDQDKFDWDDLINRLEELDEKNQYRRFSSLKEYFPLLNSLADYVIDGNDENFSKLDKTLWKEIKEYIK